MIHHLEISAITSVYQFIQKIENHLQLFYSNKKTIIVFIYLCINTCDIRF